MEQAAASTLSGLFAQLGIVGVILAVLVAGAFWYLKASKELRTEKRDVIKDLKVEIAGHIEDKKELESQVTQLTRELLDCQYPERRGVSDEST